ncbi:DUF4105 domain-containing protein [Fulvivirga sedimenti]|uniref:DUF4105 domain-containing protein n=1 Tax=Fulvivirga sedimenti TaxID=2879465 RepID=A0A9X1HUI5_9BACT|nr:DUF4105 domain-containing protein [Fulvivirga sedimenti]MCA6078195.1 DUF4105 domain-containing protein [Fulvivirga sedimenti]
MKSTLTGLLILVLGFSSTAQVRLSPDAEIRILTCGPYQGELYSAFGHSAIRVTDPVRGFDYIFNYGVFDFNQPNFYLNFARGFLNYQLALSEYSYFRDAYIRDNRYIHEQVLNLNTSEKQEFFNFLQWNIQEENRFYYYDYFYDNCATRVRDALIRTFGDSIQFDGSYITTDYTIRDLTDIYLQEQPWGDLGIDLCLGLPMDTVATPPMYMFLPDYIEQGFNHAYIIRDGQRVPLVKETIVTYDSTPEPDQSSLITPFITFSIALVFGIWLTWKDYKRKKRFRWLDFLLFTITGLVGWLLAGLWFATDHNAAARNLNLLWAIPLYFPVSFWLLKNESPRWVRKFFMFTAGFMIILVFLWALLPQDLHNSLIPFALLLGIRSWRISKPF